MSAYGCQATCGTLERVLVRPGRDHVERYGWRGVPAAAAAAPDPR